MLPKPLQLKEMNSTKLKIETFFKSSDGGKPEIFQNPGFGFNPGFEIKNPGFSGSKLLVIRDLETGSYEAHPPQIFSYRNLIGNKLSVFQTYISKILFIHHHQCHFQRLL